MVIANPYQSLSHAEREKRPLLPQRPRPGSYGVVGRAVLCTLAVQNACQMLSMRYSRMPGQPKYLSSTAVVLAEVVKMLASFVILVVQKGPADAWDIVWRGVFVRWQDTLMVGVPSMLYLLQNNLLYVATTHLDAATCQVAYQLKLLTTAFFTVTLLKRHISNRRWLSLGVLFMGVVLVQSPSKSASAANASPVIGMAAVTAACLLSGLAGVWLERIVKRDNATAGTEQQEKPIWLRNIQLGFISLVLGLCSVFVMDRHAVRAAGFFQGYTWVTASVIAQVSLGGLLVGLVMKYADNVVKGFATSLSIVISSAVSWFIPSFNFQPDLMFILGSSLVIVATLLYSGVGERRIQVAAPTKTEQGAV